MPKPAASRITENSQSVGAKVRLDYSRGHLLRGRMAARWAEVLDLLETGKKRTKDGQTLIERWAELTLENPSEMFAFVNAYILPKEQETQSNQQLTSIQNLYLTAIQQASKMPAPLALDASHTLPSDDSDW